MPTLKDLLKGEQGGEYTDVTGYLKDPSYTDAQIVDITDRQIGEIMDQTSTYGEERSQLLTFRADRKPDGYDLTKATLKIGYQLIDGTGGESAPINVKANSDYIQFSWLIPAAATQKAGKLLIMVYAVASSYTYKTLAKQYEIKETLEIGGTIPEPDANWYTDFIRQMDAKITQAASSATNAANSAAASEKSKTDAAVILEQTKQVKENAIAGIGDKCSSYAEIDKIKNVTLSGNAEGSYISVTDAASWRLSNLTLAGKSQQAAYTGKNLCPNTGKSGTVQGIEFLVNADGTIAFGGTCTASSDLWFSLEKIQLTSGTYTISGISGGSASTYYLRMGTGSTNTWFAEVYNGSKTFTLSEPTLLTVTLSLKPGIAFAKTVVSIQLEKGSAATNYEPYTGAKPSPSPDYPQEITGVENAAVMVCGKNLFPVLTEENVTPNNVIGNLVLGSAVQTMTSAVLTPGKIVVPAGETIAILNGVKWVNLKPNTKYTLHAKLNVYTGKIYRLFNQANFEYRALNNGLISVPFTTDADGVRSYAPENFLYIARGSTYTQDEITISDIQLEEGEATAYEPYTGHTAALTDVTLRSLPDGTADRLEKRSGVWGIERNINSVSGSDLTKYAESNGYYAYRCYIPNMGVSFLSNYFNKSESFSGPNMTKECIQYGEGRFFVALLASRDKTPFRLEYALATPTWEPLSDSLQAKLNSLQCCAGTTNIFTDSSLQPNMALEYIQDPNKVISDLTTELTGIKEQIAAMQA